MTIEMRDTRTAEADAQYAAWVQRGVSPATAKAMLPALVGPERVARAASAWLAEHALEGHDLSSEGVARSRATTNAARQFVQQAMEAGEFAGSPMFKTGNRYAAPEDAVHAELDRISPHSAYPDAAANARRLALSEAEKSLPHGFTLDDDGAVRDRAGQLTGESVRFPEPAKVVVSDGMVRNAPSPDTDRSAPAFYRDAPDGEWESGPNRPFFA